MALFQKVDKWGDGIVLWLYSQCKDYYCFSGGSIEMNVSIYKLHWFGLGFFYTTSTKREKDRLTKSVIRKLKNRMEINL